MVEVDGIDVQDVGVVGCSGIHVLVELAGIEGGVMVIANSEGDRVKGRRLQSASSTHKVLGKCRLRAWAEMEAAPAGARAVGPSAAVPPTRRVGIGIVVVVVGRGYFVVTVSMVSDVLY